MPDEAAAQAQQDTMLVELIPTRHSFTYGAVADGGRVCRYERGQLYTVSTALGMELLGTQRLRPATVDPPDPLEGEKEAWASMLGRLAAMGPDFRKRFGAALETSLVGYQPSKEQVTGQAQPLPVPEIQVPIAAGTSDDDDGFGELDVGAAMKADSNIDFEDASSPPPAVAAAEKKAAPKPKAKKKAKKKKKVKPKARG